MMRQHDLSPRDRTAWAFRVVTSRQPGSDELNLLMADLMAYQQDFQKHPRTANQLLTVGDKPYNDTLDPIQLAAYALVANTILNLDESITQN